MGRPKKEDLKPETIVKLDSLNSGDNDDYVTRSNTDKLSGMGYSGKSGLEILQEKKLLNPVYEGEELYALDNLQFCVKNESEVQVRWAFCKRKADGSIDYSRLMRLQSPPLNYVRITPLDLKDGVNIELEKQYADGVQVAMMCLKDQYNIRQMSKQKDNDDKLNSQFEKDQVSLGPNVHAPSLKVETVQYSKN